MQTKRKGSSWCSYCGSGAYSKTDRIPPLPHDDCASLSSSRHCRSRVSLGDGKRLATSVGMATELGDIGKQKNRSLRSKIPPKTRQSLSSSRKTKVRDSDNLPNPGEGTKTAHSTFDELPSRSQGNEHLNAPTDDQAFPSTRHHSPRTARASARLSYDWRCIHAWHWSPWVMMPLLAVTTNLLDGPISRQRLE